MDLSTKPSTFNSFDWKNDRTLICPHGPDPVLLGVRGESPSAVRRAFELLLPIDNLLGYMIFRSNQGTGEHLRNFLDPANLKAYTCGRMIGRVLSQPRIEQGGHVFLLLQNEKGSIDCAAYEPTGSFRKSLLSLLPGDYIEVGGSVRKKSRKHSAVLNLEYFRPLSLVKLVRKCAFPRNEFRPQHWSSVEREIKQYRIYLPEAKAQRHLTKPLQRYDRSSRKSFEQGQHVHGDSVGCVIMGGSSFSKPGRRRSLENYFGSLMLPEEEAKPAD